MDCRATGGTTELVVGARGAGFGTTGVREIETLRLACPRLEAASTASGGPTCCIADAGESLGVGGAACGVGAAARATGCAGCAGLAGVVERAAGRLGENGERVRSASADRGEVVARPGSRLGGDISNEREAGCAAS